MTEENTPLSEGLKKKILQHLGIEKIPQEMQDEIIAKFGEVVFKEILLQTLERLDEDQQKEYERMLERNASPEEMEVFLKERIPDYEQLIFSVIDSLMKDIKDASNVDNKKEIA
ncbi:MAG: hypothetical protein EOM19_03495 [Candidatus Moranbacteria bacterium]|nr:hypothetical protein [Candidatus Moranbacteria bacterium]